MPRRLQNGQYLCRKRWHYRSFRKSSIPKFKYFDFWSCESQKFLAIRISNISQRSNLNWSQAEMSVCTKHLWFYDKSLCLFEVSIGHLCSSQIPNVFHFGTSVYLPQSPTWDLMRPRDTMNSRQELSGTQYPLNPKLNSATEQWIDLKSPRFLWNSINIQFKRFQSEIK